MPGGLKPPGVSPGETYVIEEMLLCMLFGSDCHIEPSSPAPPLYTKRFVVAPLANDCWTVLVTAFVTTAADSGPYEDKRLCLTVSPENGKARFAESQLAKAVCTDVSGELGLCMKPPITKSQSPERSRPLIGLSSTYAYRFQDCGFAGLTAARPAGSGDVQRP